MYRFHSWFNFFELKLNFNTDTPLWFKNAELIGFGGLTWKQNVRIRHIRFTSLRIQNAHMYFENVFAFQNNYRPQRTVNLATKDRKINVSIFTQRTSDTNSCFLYMSLCARFTISLTSFCIRRKCTWRTKSEF